MGQGECGRVEVVEVGGEDGVPGWAFVAVVSDGKIVDLVPVMRCLVRILVGVGTELTLSSDTLRGSRERYT